MKSIESIVSIRNDGEYQRENFDSFLSSIHFSYKLPSIHISGTNGKGTTARYLASIYEEAGYIVGLFSSPFLNEVNEMITINGVNITDKQLFDIINANKKQIDKFNLSQFEIETFVALTFFMESHCDVAIIECGMGGLIDATNVFTPILSIVTSISLEHTETLGRTLTEIAIQKGGIIKYGIPVLINELSNEPFHALVDIAHHQKSPLFTPAIPNNLVLSSNGYSFDYATYHNLQIKSLGEFSVYNACLAIEAVSILNELLPISEQHIVDGLYKVDMPARMSVVCQKPFVIVDGAHNSEAVEKLVESMEKIRDSRSIFIVFACFRDKNFSAMINHIGQLGEVYLTTFPHPRARDIDDYFLYADEYQYDENCKSLIFNLMSEHPDDIILVTGSLAFAGYIKTLFEDGEL